MAGEIKESDLLEFGVSVDSESFKQILQNFNFIDKAIAKLNISVEKLNQKINSTDFVKLNAEFQKLSKTLNIKTKNELINDKQFTKLTELSKISEQIKKVKVNTSSLTAKNRELAIADLNFKTKQNNFRAKNQDYLKAEVEYHKSIKEKQDAINKALTDAGLETKKVNKETKNTSNSTKDWLKNISKLAISFFSVRKLGSLLGSLVKQSGSWIENLNLFAVTFGDNYQETLDWALEFAERLGVSNNEIVKMTGLFKQLSSAIGIADETGDDLSETLTKLTYDFSSFYNIADIETVAQKLQSGIFSGQVRTLRTLGIDVSQESIDNLLKTNESLAQLGTSARQLTQMQKVLARVILTMQSGANAFGDMSRSIETLQNRIRVFQGSLDNLKLALGDLIAEPAREFMAYINGFIQALTTAIRAITPIKTELTYDIGENIFTEVSEDVDELSSSLGLLSFDKFETLSSGSENEDLAITEALTQELEKQQQYYEQMASQFDGIDEETAKIRDNILDWIFPYRTEEALGEFNPILVTIYETTESIVLIIKKLSDSIGGLILDILKIINSVVLWLDKNELLIPTLQVIIGYLVASKTLTALTSITKAISLLNTNLGAFGIAIGVFATLYTILDSLEGKDKVIFGIVTAVSALAIAFTALTNPLLAPVKVPLVVASIGAGVAGVIATIKGVSGFEDGGIPNKSELFYMNEYGVPEALINTGGSQTNVVNMQQLRQMTKEGFIEAINETGLANGFKMTIEGRNIDNNSIARGIFPALKVESTRRGGNQL